MSISSYPLHWPAGWKRTSGHNRKNAQFNKRETKYRTGYDGKQHSWTSKKFLTVSDGVERIIESLGRMGVSRDDVIISTNVRTRLDGLPRSGEREPDDPGAAVYWRIAYDKPMKSMAVDRYTSVADNLAAIAATLDAMRAIERHGGAEILERTFQGFTALPAQASSTWRAALGFKDSDRPTLGDVERRFRDLAKVHHPDVAGGSAGEFRAITDARAAARTELA